MCDFAAFCQTSSIETGVLILLHFADFALGGRFGARSKGNGQEDLGADGSQTNGGSRHGG